ncbi:MAG: PH domain-containing protein [Leifsonia sp.]
MNLTDGEWHRLHPASPLLRGGIAFVAIAGIVIANLRERFIELFFHVPSYGDDPLDEVYARGLVGWALLAVLVVILAIIAGFYLSWRMHSFRVTDDLVEVRSGLLFRTHRRARLDRIQGVTINRALIPRLFGAAKIDISVAGNDGNVQLAYLGSAAADGLRREILRLASGSRTPLAEQQGPGAPIPAPADGLPVAEPVVPGILNQRVSEFLAPELDPDAAPPESVVRIPILRLVLSVLLSGYTLFLVAAGIAMAIGFANGAVWPVFAVLPVLIGGFSFYFNRVTRMLRYSIAGTPDGVRVGYGLLSTNNETLPPGRIHAIGVVQPLLWRPFGWWRIQVNTAGRARSDGQNRDNTTVMPVGSADDVGRVLGLILPAFVGDEAGSIIHSGLLSRGAADDGFTSAPRRAAWLRPFSWRRTGFRGTAGALLLRHGVLSRHLAIVPYARMQSVAITQGPIDRALGLAAVHVQTVSGPVSASLDVADTTSAQRLFAEAAVDAVEWAQSDTSHHWRAS